MKVLIVDDSLLFRTAISNALSGNSLFEIVGKVCNGKEAVDFVKANKVDIVTMDLEMPEMDGVEATREIRTFDRKTKILLFSSHTLRGADKTLQGLNAGADDFVTKPSSTNLEEALSVIEKGLVRKMKDLFDGIESNIDHSLKLSNFSDIEASLRKPGVICIGSSTGGPTALNAIFSQLKNNFRVPMVLVQHMPPLFTQQLAHSLDRLSDIKVKEAEDGDKLESGICLVAPGGYHLVFEKDGSDYFAKLNQKEKICHVRPAVNATLESLIEHFGRGVTSIIMTGMGDDGLTACKKLHERGGQIFIQDKESSVVWGMAGAIFQEEIADGIFSLNQLSELINKIGR